MKIEFFPNYRLKSIIIEDKFQFKDKYKPQNAIHYAK